MLTCHPTYSWYLGLLHHWFSTSPSSSFPSTLNSVFDLQNENLCDHYENTRPVTSISLFGWPFLDLESSSYRPFIAIISTLPSSLLSHCAKNQQSPFGNTKTQHSVNIISVVSNATCPRPLHALSIIVDLSNFYLSPCAVPCFEKHLRKL